MLKHTHTHTTHTHTGAQLGYLTAKVEYEGEVEENTVGRFMSINDTSASQSLAQDNAIDISITGQSFVSETLTDYALTFTGTDCTGMTSTVTPNQRTHTSAYVNVLKATIDTSGCSSDVYVQLNYSGSAAFTSLVPSSAKNIAQIISVTDTTATKSLAPTTGQSVTITGTGLPTETSDVSSLGLKFAYDSGTCSGLTNFSTGELSAASGGNTEISSDASSITIKGLDLTDCLGVIQVSLSRSATTLDFLGIGTIVEIQNTLTSKYLIEYASQTITVSGNGFGDSTASNFVLQFGCIDRTDDSGAALTCSDSTVTGTKILVAADSSGSELKYTGNLTMCSVGQILCARVNYASQSSPQVWNSVASIATVDAAENAVRDHSSQTFNLTGYGSPSKILIYADANCSTSCCNVRIGGVCACAYDVNSTTTTTSSMFLIENVDMSECTGNVYASIPASSTVFTTRSSSVRVGYIVSVSDTSAVYSVARGDTNATITVVGAGFADTDGSTYAMAITVGGSCSLNSSDLTVTRLTITTLQITGLKMNTCTGVSSGYVAVTMSYGGTSTDQSGAASWQLSPVNVAGVLAFDEDKSTTQPIFENTDFTITGSGFGTELQACTDCDRTYSCQKDGTYETFSNTVVWTRKSSTEINLKVTDSDTCNGIFKLVFKYDNVDVATILIGTFVTLDDVVDESICISNTPGVVTKQVTGSGFLSTSISKYNITFYCSYGNNTIQELSSQIASRSSSSAFNVQVNFDNCAYDETYYGIIYHNIEYDSTVLKSTCSTSAVTDCAKYGQLIGIVDKSNELAYVASTANNVNVTTIGMLGSDVTSYSFQLCSGQTLQPDTRTVNNNVQLLYEGNANLASCTLFCVFILFSLFFFLDITHSCFSQLQSHLFFNITITLVFRNCNHICFSIFHQVHQHISMFL